MGIITPAIYRSSAIYMTKHRNKSKNSELPTVLKIECDSEENRRSTGIESPEEEIKNTL